MYLQSLSITQFKNYEKAAFTFSSELNFITGNNGSGKTNLLDAIHYLCLGKSYFHFSDQNSVRHDQLFFRIEGNFENEDQSKVICTFQTGQKKELQRNGVPYQRLIDHVGRLPVVMITPDDQLLIDEGSENRRRFIDNTISQIDHAYLETLIQYNRVLQQRNAALKSFAFRKQDDPQLIESFDEQLAPLSTTIFSCREDYFLKMLPIVTHYYHVFSDGQEEVSATYESSCRNADVFAMFKKSYQKDCITQRTNEGVHRDDFDFYLNGTSLKKFGSQGQKKSFLMALKFAQFELISEERNIRPLLLLDDLFDKLDPLRSQHILQLIDEARFSQVFITDANQQRIEKSISESKRKCAAFVINGGTAVRID